MLPSLQETVVMFNQEHNRSDEIKGNRRRAVRQFWQAYSRGKWRRLLGRLAGFDNQLRHMDEALRGLQVKSRHYVGMQSVPVERIRGSEGRSRDFDAEFNPLAAHNDDRWISLATAVRRGATLPPVELFQVGESYFVRDGHHRISIARSLGQQAIDAEVIRWEVES
jgi:hypothetical protein